LTSKPPAAAGWLLGGILLRAGGPGVQRFSLASGTVRCGAFVVHVALALFGLHQRHTLHRRHWS